MSAPLHAGIHTPRPDTPQADTPRQTPPLADTPAQCMLGYGQQAGSTHPTGMHSCNVYVEPFLKSFKPSTSDLSHFTIDSTLVTEVPKLKSRTFLPPANEVWGKVMFLHLSVILFTGGGGCILACNRAGSGGVCL